MMIPKKRLISGMQRPLDGDLSGARRRKKRVEALQNLLRERVVKVVRNLEQSLVLTQDTTARALHRHQPGDRLARLGEHDLFTRCHQGQKPRELGLGFLDIHLSHTCKVDQPLGRVNWGGFLITSRTKSPDSDRVRTMKITADIEDALLEEAKRVASRDQTTLRALIEDALRRVVNERKKTQKLRLEDASFREEGLQPDVQEATWDRLRNVA